MDGWTPRVPAPYVVVVGSIQSLAATIQKKRRKKKTKYGVRTSTIAVVYVCLSPSTAAWPGSVIEDDLVRKSEGQSGQRMQAAVPARHGSRRRPQPSRQPASRPLRARQLGDASIASCAAASPPSIPLPPGQVTLSICHRGKKGVTTHSLTGQPAAHHVSTPYRSELFQLYNNKYHCFLQITEHIS
jgi:hypothetical protein